MSGTDERGAYSEEALIEGDDVWTPELHNIGYNSDPRAGCHVVADGKWCFKRTNLAVSTPNQRWIFVGEPTVKLVEDSTPPGSAAWNRLGQPDVFFVDRRNPNKVEAYVLTNSRKIKIRLVCLARYYP